MSIDLNEFRHNGYTLIVIVTYARYNIDRLVQERHNSSALAMELSFLHWPIDVIVNIIIISIIIINILMLSQYGCRY